MLRAGDAHFKGETGYASYQEGGMVKYTIGSSANYNEISDFVNPCWISFLRHLSSPLRMDRSTT